MSLPTFPFAPEDLTRDDAINLILSSIAMEEVSLSHIINAEGEKIQYMLGTLSGMTAPAGTVDQVLKANESVQKMLQSASYNQMFLSAKMENALAASESNLTPPTPPTPPITPPTASVNTNILTAVSAANASSLYSKSDGTENTNMIIGQSSAETTGRIGNAWLPPDNYAYFLPLQIVSDGTIPEWTAQMVTSSTIVRLENSPPLIAQLWYAPPMANSPFNANTLAWQLIGTIDLGALSLSGEDEIYSGKQLFDPPITIAGEGFLSVLLGIDAAVESTIGTNMSSANIVIAY